MQIGETKRRERIMPRGTAGDTDGAREFLAAHRLAELPEAVFRLGEAWALCEQCSATGDVAGAERLYGLLAAFAPRDGRAGPWSGAVAHYLGLLAGTLRRWDVAAAHFEDALRAAASGGAAIQARATQLGYARALLARAAPGDAMRAEHLLGELLVGSQVLAGPPPDEPSRAQRVEPAAGPMHYVFRREGDFWAMAGGGRVARLRGLRGFDYMSELLRHPHQEIYAVDLVCLGAARETVLSAAQAAEHGLRVAAAPAADATLDRRARQAYRERWNDLRVEADDAARDNDLGRAARLREEIDILAQELATATRGGRGIPTAQERARVNVRNCITAALRAIRRHDEPLWRHLANTIKTGTFCTYAPDRPVDWDL